MSLIAVLGDKSVSMKELLRTTNIVLLSYVDALLSDAGLSPVVADSYISAVEGSIGAFPRRVLVAVDEWSEGVAILVGAGLGCHLANASVDALPVARASRRCP